MKADLIKYFGEDTVEQAKNVSCDKDEFGYHYLIYRFLVKYSTIKRKYIIKIYHTSNFERNFDLFKEIMNKEVNTQERENINIIIEYVREELSYHLNLLFENKFYVYKSIEYGKGYERYNVVKENIDHYLIEDGDERKFILIRNLILSKEEAINKSISTINNRISLLIEDNNRIEREIEESQTNLKDNKELIEHHKKMIESFK